MEEDRRKHLEFIQNVITRMNTNSFQIKGWTVTLVSGLLALDLAGGEQIQPFFTVLPILPFWILDGFYLSRERRYRKLYKEVISNTSSVGPFAMETEIFESNERWFNSIFSQTQLVYYGTLVLLVVGILIFEEKII